MPEIPALTDTGFLPQGIYNATLPECIARFAVGSEKREALGRLLTEVVNAAREYPTIKRVLAWGSFVTDNTEPNDLDYSFVCSVMHRDQIVLAEHRRFLVPSEAHIFYGVDRSYLEIKDYPIERFAEQMLFLCSSQPTAKRSPIARGIIEIVTTTEGNTE